MHNREHWISGFRRLLRPFRSAVNAIFAKLQDRLLLHCFPISFKVLEFRLFDSSDSRDERWEEWSRVYEYEFILEKVKKLSKTAQISIHNTCWGYQGIHLKFKDELESKYSQVTNSDMLSSALPNTQVYDLRKSPKKEWRERFDFVVNVSTIEEIESSHLKIIKHLLYMVKPGGYLLVTFDYLGINLTYIERLLKTRISCSTNPIYLEVSNRSDVNGSLFCGRFILRRDPSN